MTQTYLFYDIETTGLNKCFDQIVQFAAIRTDLNLKELERHEFSVKLNCDVIPAPAAIITHRIGVKHFQDGVSELEAIQQIHALLNTPGTISVGYNSLGFDDEFLRFSFYKNLLPPYTHQFSNNCARMDIYPITLLYYLFKKEHLHFPVINNKISLKLENLNTHNQFFEGQSHHAMVDVEITLKLAQKLAQDKKMWDYVIQYFQKNIDDSRISESTEKLEINNQNYNIGFLASGKLGADNHFMAPVIQLGTHLHYKNQLLFLRLDLPELRSATQSDVEKNTYVIRKKLAEPPVFFPFKNRYFDLLSNERKAEFEKNKLWLIENSTIFTEIKNFYQHNKYPFVPNRDVDAALYDIGFPTPAEENLFRQFHAAKPSEKSIIADKFSNKIRQEQAIRILGRFFPNFLSEKNKMQFESYLAADCVDFKNEKKLTRQKALDDIAEIRKNKKLDAKQTELLNEYEQYLNKTR